MALKLYSPWPRQSHGHHVDDEPERWSPLAALTLAMMLSVALWALIIRGLMSLL